MERRALLLGVVADKLAAKADDFAMVKVYWSLGLLLYLAVRLSHEEFVGEETYNEYTNKRIHE